VIGRTALARSKRLNRIVIADDHILYRRGLRTLLSAESDFQVVDEASDGAEALLKVRMVKPDVLVMGLQLIEHDAQHLAFAIRQAQPSIAMLFLTDEDRGDQLELAVGAGARGYMLKSSTPAQLVAGVRQVAATEDSGGTGLSKIVPDLQALAASNEQYSSTLGLTAREQEVMRLLAEGRTVREVAGELHLSIKTIEAHKLNLMRKLDIHSRASLIEYAVQKGLVEPSLIS
jgi:two-component system, NarL family, response regulator NreC